MSTGRRTESKVFPKEWELRRIGDIAHVATGTTPPPSISENYGSEFLFVSPSDMGSTKFIVKTDKRLSKKGFSVARRFPKGSVLFVCIGSTIGKCGIASVDLASNQQINAIFPSEFVIPEFLYYSLCVAAPRIKALAGEQAVPLINKSQFSDSLIPVPTLAEQHAITEALSDADALLSEMDQLIAKKRDLKQAAMQQLLTGQTRMPGFSGEWEVKRLGQICEIAIGRTPPRVSAAFWGEGYTWLSIADLRSKVVSVSREQITPLAAASMQIVPKGTLLMSFKLSIGRLCFAGCDLFTNEAICSFNKLQDDPNYLYYQLSRIDFSIYGKQAVKGFTLNKESLKRVEVALPTPAEQTAIATVLSDMDAELEALEQRRAKTAALKQGMMQELLTGRTRLV